MQQVESSASRRRGLASEQPAEPSRQEREASVHPEHAPSETRRPLFVNASSTTVNLEMPVTTSPNTGGVRVVMVRLEATTSTGAGATTAWRIEALHPSHQALRSLARPFAKHCFRLDFAPTTLTKYNSETKPELWLANFCLAYQLGGATDDRVIIRQLPLFLSDTARAWLEDLLPQQIHDWNDLVRVFERNFKGTYMRPGNSWDLQSYKQKLGESLQDYIRCFSKQRTELPNITDSDVIMAFLYGTTCEELVRELGLSTPITARLDPTSQPRA
jgi:hypothetical protein